MNTHDALTTNVVNDHDTLTTNAMSNHDTRTKSAPRVRAGLRRRGSGSGSKYLSARPVRSVKENAGRAILNHENDR